MNCDSENPNSPGMMCQFHAEEMHVGYFVYENNFKGMFEFWEDKDVYYTQLATLMREAIITKKIKISSIY